MSPHGYRTWFFGPQELPELLEQVLAEDEVSEVAREGDLCLAEPDEGVTIFVQCWVVYELL